MDTSISFPNLGLNLSNVERSIHIFGFEITFYGMLIALGMLLGLGFMILEAKRCHENPNDYLGMMITSLLTGMIGARLFYVAFNWSLFRGAAAQIINLRNGGMGFYGALFGGMMGAFLYCLIRRLPFGQMADTASMGILIGQIIGRWGDFFNRESFGGYSNSVLAMQLPLTSVDSRAVTSVMREKLEVANGISCIQVHPVFLYESAWCLLLLLLVLVWRRKKAFQGEVFLRYLTGYGLGRFFFEWMRTDKLLIPGTEIGISQVISAVLFVFCGSMAIVQHNMAKKRAALKRRRREREYELQEWRTRIARERSENGQTEEASSADPDAAEKAE